MNRFLFSGFTTAMAVLAFVLSPSWGYAATNTWNANVNNAAWNTAANWSPNSNFPNGIGDVAIFGNVITANRTVRVNPSVTVGAIEFNEDGAFSYTISQTGGSSITFDNAGSGAAIRILSSNNAGAAHTLNLPIILADSLTIDNDSAAAFTISGAITTSGNSIFNAGSGSGIVTISGAIGGAGGLTQNSSTSILVLSGANTYSGATTVSAGTLRANALNTFSVNSAVTVNGGATLDLNNFNQSVASIAGAGSINVGTATLTSGIDNSSTLFSGGLSGAGNLTKVGSGTLTLSGANTHGSSTISNGTLAVTGTHTGSVLAESGANLVGSGTVGAVTLNSGGSVSGGTSGVGTLTTGNNVWNSGGIYKVDVSAANGAAGTTWDFLTINGTVTLNATPSSQFILDLLGSPIDFDNQSSYSWHIASATGGFTGFDPAAFNVLTSGFSPDLGGGTFFLSLVNGNQDLFLNFAPVPEPSTIALGVMGGLALVGSAWHRRRKNQ